VRPDEAVRSAPLLLPHVDVLDGVVRVHGAGVDAFSPAEVQLLRESRGERPLEDLDASERETIARARRHGLLVLVPLRDERKALRSPAALVVSPHPDDATLSLGATLAGTSARVVNVFSVETWTGRSFYAQRPDQTSALLLDEERVACRVLDVDPLFLGFVDAPARGWGDQFMRAGEAHSPEVEAERVTTTESVAEALAACVADAQPRIVFAPLAVASHVDHLICRDAVLALVLRGVLAPGQARFYEDLPYAVFEASDGAAAAAQAALGESGVTLTEIVAEATATAAGAKAEALQAYRIQLRDGIRRRVIAHGWRLGAGQDPPRGFCERWWAGDECRALP